MNLEGKLAHLDTNLEFLAWPKIPRGQKELVVITEKMDGTNACIVIRDGKIVGVQSRNRFITVGKQSDNAGFAAWVAANEEMLLDLGDGHHYGEWCGPNIQGNPHRLSQKIFYLFNTFRWGAHNEPPLCCEVVPVLYYGELEQHTIHTAMEVLEAEGTYNAEQKEGVIVYFTKTRRYEKHTFRDQEGKWKSTEKAA